MAAGYEIHLWGGSMTGPEKGSSWFTTFFTSIPGILTGIAAVLAAITGLYLALHKNPPADTGATGGGKPQSCSALANMSLHLTTHDGAVGVIGPSGILLSMMSDGKYHFQTTANFTNAQVDPVDGTCWGDSILFVRTRPGVWIQSFYGILLPPTVHGTLQDNVSRGSTTWDGDIRAPN